MLPVFVPMYPEGDKEHEGDGWYFARSGKRYWGQFGAAGALLVRKGANGKNEYLLGKRAAWMSSGGGKWAYPGGAHSNAENAFFTLRTVASEVKEELGIDLDDYQFSGLDEFDSQVEPDWKYTTLFIPEPPSGFPEPKISDIETELTGWFTADDIKQMDAQGSLHESMSAVLDELLAKGEETVFSTEQVHLDPDSDAPKAFVARYGMSSGDIQRMAEDLSRHFRDFRARLATKLETQNSIEDTLKGIPDAKKDSLSALRITFEGLLKEVWSGPKLTPDELDEKFHGILLNALDGNLDEDDDARDEVTLGSTVVDGVRIEPTGAPVREIENPLPLSESGIAGVPSLGSAVALVRSGAENIDRPPGGLAAVAAAVDGVDIEDLEVRVFPVVTPDGENRIRLKFKLTAWSGTMLAEKIEKSIDGAGQKLGWTKTDAGRVQLQASTLDSATGKLILSNDKVNPGYGAYQGASANDVFPWEDDGISYFIDPDDAETPDSSPRIEFIRSTADPRRLGIPTGQYIGAPAAFHNLVTIDLPYDATESDIADALRLAGVRDVRSADRTDANTLIENKLMSQFSGDTNPAYNVLKPELRADMLEGIENKWGAKAEDVDIVNSSSGRIEYLLPESVAEKLVKNTGVTYMLHTIHNGLRDEIYAEQQRRHEEGRINNIPYEETVMTLAQKSEVAAKFIARLLAKGSLQSTVTRSTEGIPVRGWSTLEDIATGGADYVFLSPRDIKGAISLANDGLNPTDIEFIWESKPLFRNMSTYANAYDAYGERSDGTKIFEVRSGYSEFIVKNQVSFDTLDTLSVAAGVKGPLIEELTQMGITEIGGKPLDEVIEIVGERSKSRVAEEKGMSAEEVAKVAQTLSDAGIEGIDYDDYTWSLKAAFPEKFPDGFIPAPAGSKVIMAPDTYLTVGGAYKDAVGLTVLEPNGQIYVYHKNGEDSTKPELVWQAGQGGAEKLADHLAESAKSGNLVKKYLPKPGEFGSMQTSTGITEHSAKIVYVVGLKDASADVQVGAYPNVPGGHTGADQPVVSATVEPPSLETIMAAYRMWIGSGDPASSVLSILSAYLNVRIPLELRVILTEIINAVNTGDMRWEERNPEFLSKVTKKMTELSVRNSSQAGARAMTADGEEIAVLPMSSLKELIETRSYVNDYVLLEVMSGKGKGSTRRVAHIQTIDQGDHTGNIALYIPTEENALILPLDKNKNVVFGPGNRFGTFTSRGIKYRIKPIPAVKNQTKPAQSSEPTDGR
jgi:8-oxo-dGTP pyrophosphatase MutT (NUDIX family)